MKLAKCWSTDGLFVHIYIDIVEAAVTHDLKTTSTYFMSKVFMFSYCSIAEQSLRSFNLGLSTGIIFSVDCAAVRQMRNSYPNIIGQAWSSEVVISGLRTGEIRTVPPVPDFFLPPDSESNDTASLTKWSCWLDDDDDCGCYGHTTGDCVNSATMFVLVGKIENRIFLFDMHETNQHIIKRWDWVRFGDDPDRNKLWLGGAGMEREVVPEYHFSPLANKWEPDFPVAGCNNGWLRLWFLLPLKIP